MATKLTALPKRRGRAQVHPWNEWADGSAWKIVKDEDFQGDLESMRTQLYGKARSLGKTVALVVDKDEQSISFQMTPKTED